MQRIVFLTLLAVAAVSGVARSEETRPVAAPDYRRVEAELRQLRQNPNRAPLPDALRSTVVAPDPAPPAKDRSTGMAHDRRGGGAAGHFDRGRPEAGPPRPSVIETQARREARWAAEQLVRARGEAAYYRVGFRAGLRAGVDDPSIGRFEFLAGRRQGSQAWRPRSEGQAFGRSLAAQRAGADAADAARDQFMDLRGEPRYLTAPAPPRVDVDPPPVPAPTLRDVMGDHPLAGFRGPFGGRYDRLAGFGADAHRWYAARDYRDVDDAAWRDPGHAFRWWKQRRSSVLRPLREYEREVFAAEFRRAFRRYVASAHGRALERAYDAGLDDGWSYGAFVNEEWNYRRGYHEGFRHAWVQAARRSFDAAYAGAWTPAFADVFGDWSRNAKPAIVGLRLGDGNADGVFEPGEAFHVEYEVANYGGAAAAVPVRLRGTALASAPAASLYLPARTVTTAILPGAVLHRAQRPRTQVAIELAVADARERARFDVRRPLQFVPAGLRVDRDNLAGRLQVSFGVENISRKPITTDIVVRAAAGIGFHDTRDLSTLGAGETRRVSIAVDGLDPLDLLAGQVAIGLDLEAGGVAQDSLRHAVPEVATDRRNRDLLSYLTALAAGSPFTLTDLERARGLMLDRLRADWRDAVRASGNPYKRDLNRAGTETALGELVTALDIHRSGMVQPEVFDGMAQDVIALSRDLPGPHPFLRKSMRRLATALP